MFKCIQVTLLSCLIVLVTGGYASLIAVNKIAETIKPSGIHEDCMELLPGQIMEYSFESSRPVNFNLHCHEDSGVEYQISKDGVSTDKGTFRCEKKQHYCLMWTNPSSEPVSLNYDYRLRSK